MKVRNVVLSVMLLVVTMCLFGCSSENPVNDVKEAIKKYEDSKDTKVVYCYVNSGNKSTMSVEVKDGDNHYTEMPYNSEDSDSTEASEVDGASNQQYLLYDWVKKDGKAYTLNSAYNEDSEDSKLWIEMPEGYGKSIWGRANLYAEEMLDTQSLKKAGTEKINRGSGDVEVQTYECDIKQDKIRSVLEKETTNLIQLAQDETKKKDDSKNKEKVEKFLTDTLDEYKSTSAYADGKVIYGLKDGELVYVRLETGGLGTSYTLERIVLDQEVQVRDEPTFKDNTSSYFDLVLSYVEYQESLKEDNAGVETQSAEEGESVEEVEETPEPTEKSSNKK